MFTEDVLAKLPGIVAGSFSNEEVLEKLGMQNSGQAHKNLRQLIKSGVINVSHFSGQAWRSKTNRPVRGAMKYRLDDVLVRHSPVSQKVLRTYVEAYEVIPYRCSSCGCDGNWNGGTIKLQLDHINGDNTDNRRENLRYLCPNCHSMTETFGGRNKALNGQLGKIEELLRRNTNCIAE